MSNGGAGPGTIDRFPIPGVRTKGDAGDAAPDSVLGQLRAAHGEQREAEELTVSLPPIAGFKRRARYGVISIDDMEEVSTDGLSQVEASMVMMARACRAIEVYDEANDRWQVLEDDTGPVSFDDRYARLLQWERPGEGDEFTYTTRQVYEAIFNGNGFALSAHITKVAAFMAGGAEDLQSLMGELSAAGLTTPAPPSRSG